MSASSTSTVLAAAGVNLALSAVIATFTIFAFTGQNELFREQGKQSAQLGTLIESTTSLVKSVQEIGQGVVRLDRKIELASVSVRKMIANAGIPIDEGIEYVSIGDQIVALPETAEAAKTLQDRNFQRVNVTPAIGGYALDAASAAVVRQTIDNAIGLDR